MHSTQNNSLPPEGREITPAERDNSLSSKQEPTRSGLTELPSCLYLPSDVRRFKHGKFEFAIGYASGKNAYGLIGTERAGSFLICLTSHCFMLDEVRLSEVERARIAAMRAKEFKEFAKTCSYDPFSEETLAKAVIKRDKKIFRQFQWSGEANAASLDVARAFEQFVVARTYGGSEFAFQCFQHCVYELLHIHYGFIAHYDRLGFYNVQMRNTYDFKRNLKMIADGKTLYGWPSNLKPPLDKAMAQVASAYVNCKPKP